MLRTALLVYISLSALWPVNSAFSKEITILDLVYLTENYPPHNYIENNQLKGVSVEILQLIWKELNIPDKTATIEIVPWARGMYIIKHKPNIVLFGMGYSRERVEQLHWVGSYYSHSLGLIGKKSAHHTIKSLAEAEKLTVGAVRDDMGNSQILKMGFPQSSIELSNNQQSLFLKLRNNRIDLISFSDDAAWQGMKKAGLDPADYEMVLKLKYFQSGFGFSKQVPQRIIDDFQQALDDLIKNGSVKKILLKYKLITE